MAITETSICNSALIKIGSDRITALSDDNRRAIVCKEQYSKMRDEVLDAHPWNFAMDRIELAQDADDPAFDWEKQYIMPNNMLRVVRLSDALEDEQWAIEGRKILSNSSTMKVVYIKQVTDTSRFTPVFAELLSWRLAADLAWAISQNRGLSNEMFDKYIIMLKDARSRDAQEGTPEDLIADTFINARL